MLIVECRKHGPFRLENVGDQCPKCILEMRHAGQGVVGAVRNVGRVPIRADEMACVVGVDEDGTLQVTR